MRKSTITYKISGYNSIQQPGATTYSSWLGDYGDIKDVVYAPECDMNIISGPQLVLQGVYNVILEKQRTYICTSAKGCKHFVLDPQMNLYVELNSVAEKYERINDMSVSTMVEVVEKETAEVDIWDEDDPINKLSKEELDRLPAVMELHKILGHPGEVAFIATINSNSIINLDITERDIMNFYRVYGYCPACKVNKSKHYRNTSSNHEPEHAVGDLLSIDIYYLKELCTEDERMVLLSVDAYTGHTMAIHLKNKTLPSIQDAMDSVIAYYAGYHHQVKQVLTDSESVLLAVNNHLNGKGILMFSNAPGEHAQRIERATQDIRQRVASVLNDMVFELPAVLYYDVLLYAILSHNNTTSINKHVNSTPSVMVTGIKLDAMVDVLIPFGTIVMCNDPNAKSKRDYGVRGEIGIFMRRDISSRGSILIYCPDERQYYRRQNFEILEFMPSHWSYVVRTPLGKATRRNRKNAVRDYQQSGYLKKQQNQIVPPGFESIMPTQPHLNQSHVVDAPVVESATPEVLCEDKIAEIHDDKAANVELRQEDDIMEPMIETVEEVLTARPKRIRKEVDRLNLQIRIDKREKRKRKQRRRRERKMKNSNLAHKTRAALRIKHIEQGLNRYHMRIMKMSIKQGMANVHADKIRTAIVNEMGNMKRLDVFEFVLYEDILPEHRGYVMYTTYDIKEKIKPDGTHDKWKFRYCVGGDDENSELFDNCFSPTLISHTLSCLIQIGAILGNTMDSIDFPAAFLNSKIPKDKYIYVSMSCEMVPFINEVYGTNFPVDKKIYARLNRYLYGLKESGREWYLNLSTTLKQEGYQALQSDPCCFVKYDGAEYSYLGLHVDDILHVTNSTKFRTELIQRLKKNIMES